MNWLDIVLLLILAASVLASFRKGFSREIVGLITVICALLAGTWFYGSAGSVLVPYLSSRPLANFVGFLLVFCAVMVLGALVSFILGKFLKVTGLSIFDHILGAGFGLVRGALISVAIVLGLMAFSTGDRPPASVVHSRVAPYVADVARVVASMAPHELKEGFRKTYAQAKSAWGKAVKKGAPGEGQHEREI